jgi:cytidylate kinase
LTSQISALPAVREVMVEQQRRIARAGEGECGGAVLEGRDIQTVVFPDADVKIFLTADTRTRAARRQHEWQDKGAQVTLDDAARDLIERDQRDSTRKTAPLQAAPDAVHVATDDCSVEEVVGRIAEVVREKTGINV